MQTKVKKPMIGITMGDPAGIGPELCLRALREPAVLDRCAPIVFGDANVLNRVELSLAHKTRHHPRRRIRTIKLDRWEEGRRATGATVIACDAVNAADVRPGEIQAACGRAAYVYIESAVKAALSGKIAAIATCPINKESFRLAGISYPGHTEMLAALTGAKRWCMMFAADEIMVSLVTIHAPLADVPAKLTPRRISDVIDLTADALKRLGKARPRIGVCGLNPHGGEHGLFGSEEREAIEPAVAEARAKGLDVEGPLVPDTAFLPERRRHIDAYVAMYHDQGLIPFKMLAFEKGVNITLGLPIVRTSVDHGTAFDIAWQGKASHNSLVQSILWAAKLSSGSNLLNWGGNPPLTPPRMGTCGVRQAKAQQL